MPVSVVTVWNDETVRRACLDASIESLRATTPDLEYLPVDNRGQRHQTAGSALNSGVRSATRDVVVFVQQDIYLHSLTALEEAAGLLMDDPTLWLAGAVGIGSDGRIRGRIRDRVVLLGDTDGGRPQSVDSLDEVLFLARRSDLLATPLPEDADLAWHAYAVEWGLRGRARGQQVVALDIPLTHNSLSTNLARLDEAHAAVAVRHPDQLPLETTCGRITAGRPARERVPVLADHRWRLRWAKASLAARAARLHSGSDRVVLGDLRRDIDRIAAEVAGEIRVHNVTSSDRRFVDAPGGIRLPRAGYAVEFTSGTLAERPASAPGDAVICTDLTLDDLALLGPELKGAEHVIGYHDDIGYWVLIGEAAERRAVIWPEPRSRPSRLLV